MSFAGVGYTMAQHKMLAQKRITTRVAPAEPVEGFVTPPFEWHPQAGSQNDFLESEMFFEVLYEGERGPGKTDALLMSFAQHCGRGHGTSWRGILFRRTFPELADVIAKAEKWFRRWQPQATYNKSTYTWEWPCGAQLLLRHMAKPQDYWSYHGHEYPWIGWEELTTWPDDKCYKVMFACCRSTNANVPRMIRSTTNPYGIGHSWVKERWQLPEMRGKPILHAVDDKGNPEPWRLAIQGKLIENQILLQADPDYIKRLRQAAANEQQLKAWMEGDWDIVSGGMFNDVFHRDTHVVKNFDPQCLKHSSWRLDRAFDWGSARPFSVGFYAESDGTELMLGDNRKLWMPRKSILRFAEWYGWNGKANEGVNMVDSDIAKGVKQRIKDMGLEGRVNPGPADNSIFDEVNKMSPAKMQAAEGVTWTRSDKSAGSRVRGWQVVRGLMKARKDRDREKPWLVITDRCPQFLRTIPVLPRDDKNLDDIDTEAEDHVADELRYRCTAPRRSTSQGELRGNF